MLAGSWITVRSYVAQALGDWGVSAENRVFPDTSFMRALLMQARYPSSNGREHRVCCEGTECAVRHLFAHTGELILEHPILEAVGRRVPRLHRCYLHCLLPLVRHSRLKTHCDLFKSSIQKSSMKKGAHSMPKKEAVDV